MLERYDLLVLAAAIVIDKEMQVDRAVQEAVDLASRILEAADAKSEALIDEEYKRDTVTE